MIRNAWKSSDYINSDFQFQNVKEVCFQSDRRECDQMNCDQYFFIKCSHILK
jgi:hypothetical protein